METNLCAHKGVELKEDEAEVLKQLTNLGLFLSKSQPPLEYSLKKTKESHLFYFWQCHFERKGTSWARYVDLEKADAYGNER